MEYSLQTTAFTATAKKKVRKTAAALLFPILRLRIEETKGGGKQRTRVMK